MDGGDQYLHIFTFEISLPARNLLSLLAHATFSPVLHRSVSHVGRGLFSIHLTSLSLHRRNSQYQGLAQPPATSTHSVKQDPCLPSTSTMSVSHRHLHPTPFSLTASHESQYSSSSLRFFSSLVVISRNGGRAICLAGAFAGQCWIVVCL